MGAEKIFVVRWVGFPFVFWVLFLFLIVVSGSVSAWFRALSMLPKATFNVAKRHFLG